MPIPWDSAIMSTGHADIDQQHQEWIRAFNQFERVVNEGKGTDALRGALNFFAQYAERHFDVEEARMEESNCTAAEANRAGHARFRKMISLLQNNLRQETANLDQVVALQIELANWLIDHICTVDVELRAG